MKIEVLFPEYCNLFADSSNVKYLQQCLPLAEFVFTNYLSEPAFVSEKVDLIYIGAMTEDMQERVIKKLMPYKDCIKKLIEDNVTFLVTSNAIEIFGDYIENENGSKIDALGIFNFYAKRDMMNRFNCLFRGTFEDMTIVGFKTQFTFAYSEEFKYPFIKVDKGAGMNPDTGTEGIHYKNFFGTYVIGPLLTLNPYFTKYLLKTIGVEDPKLAFEDVIIDAYDRRLKEFLDPKCNYY